MASTIVISGSPSDSSKTAILGDFVMDRLKARGITASHIRIRNLPGASLLAGDTSHPDITREIDRIDPSDGVVFVTPIYKASFSGLTKLFIDLLPQFALKGKVAMPLATGGTLAHVLALDYGLRPVLQSLGVRHIVQSYFVLQSEINSETCKVSSFVSEAPLFGQAMDEFCDSIDLRKHLLYAAADAGVPASVS
jgi:FMN reductase